MRVTALLLALLIFSPPCFAATFLNGEITHSEYLPPVGDPNLQPGTVLDKASVTPSDTKVTWYTIPNWYAGSWHVTQETIESIFHFDTGQNEKLGNTIKNEARWRYGYQADARGEIWHCIELPSTSTVTLENELDYFKEQKLNCLSVEAQRVVIEETGLQINTESASGKIISVFQEEAVHTYTPISKSVMREDISKKVFDSQGRALYKRTVTRKVTREKAFDPVEKFRKPFIEYLESKGLQRLIPQIEY